MGTVVNKVATSNKGSEVAGLGRKAALPKRAADFFPTNESEEESDDGGWDELHAKEAKAAKGKKPSESKSVSTNKKAAEKIVKRAKLDAGAAEVESGKVKVLQRLTTESDSEGEYDEGDDQTATLLRGFESSDEEEDPSIAPIKKRDFRNLTVPGIKQQIASRVSDVPPLSLHSSPILSLPVKKVKTADIKALFCSPQSPQDTSSLGESHTVSTNTKCGHTFHNSGMSYASAYPVAKKQDAQNTMHFLNLRVPK